MACVGGKEGSQALSGALRALRQMGDLEAASGE
jgi:hypothetical protein